jgi:hypothetical protein
MRGGEEFRVVVEGGAAQAEAGVGLQIDQNAADVIDELLRGVFLDLGAGDRRGEADDDVARIG